MHLTEIISKVMSAVKASREDVDDALHLLHNTYIQPKARIPGVVTYTTTSETAIPIDELGNGGEEGDEINVYAIDHIFDLTYETAPRKVPLHGPETIRLPGVRVTEDTLHLQRIDANHTLEIHYFQKLSPLADVPEIESEWHDLYWLGASGLLGHERNLALFFDRLTAYDRHRREKATDPCFQVQLRW